MGICTGWNMRLIDCNSNRKFPGNQSGYCQPGKVIANRVKRHCERSEVKSIVMIKNYLKVAWRNLIKDRQFTFLNLIGLSSGLACALLIYLWVTDELSIDKFNDKDSQLYEILKKASD